MTHGAIRPTANPPADASSLAACRLEQATISLGEQDKPGITHINERASENDVPIDGRARMTSDSPGVEQRPHDGNNQVAALVDSGASDNYFNDQLIPQLKLPSLDVTEDTLDDNYVSSEEMLQDVRDYGAALDFNIDIPDRDDLHREPPRGGVSPSEGATP